MHYLLNSKHVNAYNSFNMDKIIVYVTLYIILIKLVM